MRSSSKAASAGQAFAGNSARLSGGSAIAASSAIVPPPCSLMRRILVDHARGLQRNKRGGAAEHLLLDEGIVFSSRKSAAPIALDDALEDPSASGDAHSSNKKGPHGVDLSCLEQCDYGGLGRSRSVIGLLTDTDEIRH
jgi:predicted outer membrane repeat protein